MAKFGYHCQCGWNLRRGPYKAQLTRKRYAKAKEEHAQTCRSLWDELNRTKPMKDICERPSA